MRTLNIRFAIIVSVVVVVGAVLVHLWHGRQMESNAGFFYKEAQRNRELAAAAAQKGDASAKAEAEKQAIDYLTWYVRLAPNKLDALEELSLMTADQAQQGDLVLSPRKFGEAIGLLELLVRRDPKRSAARQRLIKMCLFVHRFRDAKEHLEELLKTTPGDAALLEQLAKCQVGLAEYDRALTSFQKALDADPAQFTAYTQAAALLRLHFSKPAEADAIIEKMVTANPEAYQAYLGRCNYQLAYGVRKDQAVQDLTKALQLAPNNAEVLELAAKLALAQGKFDQAMDYASRGLKHNPASASLYDLAGRAEMLRNEPTKAVELIRQGLKATDGKPELWMDLMDFLIDDNRLDEAKKALAEFQMCDTCPDYIKRQHVAYINARFQFAEGKWLAACESFEAARKSPFLTAERLKPIDICIGMCYERLGNVGQEELAYRRALRIDPNCPIAQRALVKVLRKRGQLDEAMDQYRRLSVHEGGGSALSWVVLLFQKTMQQPAEQRDWTAVEKALERAEASQPQLAEVPQLRAEMLLLRGRGDDAQRVLEEATAKTPTKGELWLALASIASVQRHHEAAEAALQQAEKLLPDSAAVRLTRAHYLTRRYGAEASGPLQKLSLEVATLPDDQKLALWLGLLDQLTDRQLLGVLCQKIREKDPGNLKVRGMTLLAAVQTKDQKRIADALADLRSVAGTNSYWYLYGQGVLTSLGAGQTKNPSEAQQKALSYLAKARESRPHWLPVVLAEAAVYEQLGNHEMTVQRCIEALDLGERSEAFIVRLMQLLLQNGQFALAQEQFGKIEGDLKRLSPQLALLAGEAALQQQDFARLARLTDQLNSAKSRDYRSELWLSRVYKAEADRLKEAKQDSEAAKRLEAAEQALRRAIALQPETPQAWITLVDLLQKAGRPVEAEKVIAEVGTRLSAKNAAITAARCYEVLGKPELAQQRYQKALAVAPDDLTVVLPAVSCYGRHGNLDQAEKLLSGVLQRNKTLQTAEVVGVQRQLAQIYHARGGFHNLEKANELLTANLSLDQDSVDDLRLKALVNLGHPRRNRRTEAVAALEQLCQAKRATADDQFLLAKTQLKLGNWPRANELFRSLIAEHGNVPKYWIPYIEGLLQHDALADADMSIARLETLTKETPITVGFRVDLLCAMDEPQSALAALKRFIDAVDQQSPERDARMHFAADKLAQLTRRLTKPEQQPMVRTFTGFAEAMYREYAKKSPRDQLVLGIFLARQGKLDEAIAIVRQYAPECSPNDVFATCIRLLEMQKLRPVHIEVLDSVVEAHLRKSERTMAMVHMLANLRAYQGRCAEAETLYREILANNGNIVSALNNLAALLALQGIKIEEALALVNRAIDLQGPDPQLIDSRATIYLALRKLELAMQDINAALEDEETAVRLFHKAQILTAANRDEEAASTMLAALRKGLKPEMLHPLELPAYQKLLPASSR